MKQGDCGYRIVMKLVQYLFVWQLSKFQNIKKYSEQIKNIIVEQFEEDICGDKNNPDFAEKCEISF